jgi:hypothetical protein
MIDGAANVRKRVILLGPREDDQGDALMEFRLTYAGALLASGRDPIGGQNDPRGENKYKIRKNFHDQLRRLWDITPFLKSGTPGGPTIFTDANYVPTAYDSHDIANLSAKHAHYGFNFVPLVTHGLNLFCGLDILMLRPDRPGDVTWGGDIDNRLKTLLDALSIPTANERYDQRTPAADEKPLFTLLEDDKLITKVSVETDQMLELTNFPPNASDARVIIAVRLRPLEMNIGNVQFG